jgi:signal transduction histidine kinase
VDAAQLRQVMDNLLRNAIEASSEGGHVTVAAKSGSRGHSIEVRDTGAGIAADDLPRIFDLYFTTKPQGTGVGLAVSQQIVSAHGGTIEVDSKPGEGTAMTIRLPLLADGGARV